jgi:hypothetical protein
MNSKKPAFGVKFLGDINYCLLHQFGHTLSLLFMANYYFIGKRHQILLSELPVKIELPARVPVYYVLGKMTAEQFYTSAQRCYASNKRHHS